MGITERKIEYVHYPFLEEDEIFYVGKSIEISSTDYAKHGSEKFIYELIKESIPISETMELIEPIEVLETLDMANNGELGNNLLIHCRYKVRVKEGSSK